MFCFSSARRTLPRSAKSLLARVPSGTQSSSATPPSWRSSSRWKSWSKLCNQVCNGQGPNECRTEYETSCTTRSFLGSFYLSWLTTNFCETEGDFFLQFKPLKGPIYQRHQPDESYSQICGTNSWEVHWRYQVWEGKLDYIYMLQKGSVSAENNSNVVKRSFYCSVDKNLDHELFFTHGLRGCLVEYYLCFGFPF